MNEDLMNKDEIIAIIEKQFKDPDQTFVLSTLSLDGYPDSRLMGNICDKKINEVYFTCQTGSRKIDEIAGNQKSSVYFTFGPNTAWLYGDCITTRDQNERKKIWNDRMLRIYKNGPDSPNMTVIKFTAKKIRFRTDGLDYIEFDL